MMCVLFSTILFSCDWFDRLIMEQPEPPLGIKLVNNSNDDIYSLVYYEWTVSHKAGMEDSIDTIGGHSLFKAPLCPHEKSTTYFFNATSWKDAFQRKEVIDTLYIIVSRDQSDYKMCLQVMQELPQDKWRSMLQYADTILKYTEYGIPNSDILQVDFNGFQFPWNP